MDSLFSGWILENPVLIDSQGIDYNMFGLSAETVEGLALTLERIHDIHGGDGLAASVFGVRHRVTNYVLKENLQHAARLFVDETRNTLHATTTGETTDRGLGNSLDVIAKN